MYLGSKAKHAKYLLPFILENKTKNQYYVEPFCGGCNMIDKVKGNRIANDSNYYLIEMWKALQNGWIPPDKINKEEYNHIMKNKDLYEPCLVAFVGFLCSFGGKFNNGFVEINDAPKAKRVLKNQIKKLKDVQFFNVSYNNLIIPENSIVYCDPPYAMTTEYNGTDTFNHFDFWNWCRNKINENQYIYIRI
jgi:DNA adenine methylase